MEDRAILRQLAYRYWEKACDPRNGERMTLHRAVNDLKMIRPVVLMDEIPFHELDFDGSLTLRCQDPILRGAEDFLRKRIFQWTWFPADMFLPPYLPVEKVIRSTGIGIDIQEERLYTDDRNNISSHCYHDQLATEEDLERLHLPVITYDREETMARYMRIADAVGDILPVRLVGQGCYTSPWDQIAMYRGVTSLLIDLAEEPEHSHRVVDWICRCEESRLRQYEELGLFEVSPTSLHCTAALCSDLPGDYDGGLVRSRHIWGRGMAQIFASVGKAMHEEFDISYMKRLMEPFGLTYYGCCEPLDKKMDIVEKLPHLRKVSITPWADVDVAAEAIGKKYVLANKPNPAAVGTHLDEEVLRKELGRTLNAVRRNGCSCDIVLKDVSTAGYDLQNLVRWERVAMELVQSW